MTQETPVETVDEHAEPFVGTRNDEIDPEIPGDDMATVNAEKSAARPGQQGEVGQPVLDVDKIEAAAGKAESTESTAADSTIPEPDDKPEVRPVTH